MPPVSSDNKSGITWEFLLAAYANGYFPMAESKDSKTLHWIYPEIRGILPLGGFHIPKSLAKFIKKSPFTITVNQAFPDVIKACSDISEQRNDTWINSEIIDLYCQLWKYGFAYSIECWSNTNENSEKSTLVGGLYGVAIGGAFFGESMFSRKTNASKVALVYLVNILKYSGYKLLDTQFINDHLKQFGAIEIKREEYLEKLAEAINITPAKFP